MEKLMGLRRDTRDVSVLRAENLIAQSRLREAADLLILTCNVVETNREISRLLFDVLMRLGRVDDAYQVGIPALQLSPACEIRASLVSVRNGQVFPGQFEFCVNYIGDGIDYRTIEANCPNGTKQDIECLSAVGCARSSDPGSAEYYYQIALEADQGNGIASFYYGSFLSWKGEYSKALKYLSLAREKCYGRLKDKADRLWNKCRNKLAMSRFLDRG